MEVLPGEWYIPSRRFGGRGLGDHQKGSGFDHYGYYATDKCGCLSTPFQPLESVAFGALRGRVKG